MTKSLFQQAASFALAAVMTVGMLGGVNVFAQVETRIGAANVNVAQTTTHAVVKG